MTKVKKRIVNVTALALLVLTSAAIGFLAASENWECPACSSDSGKITPLVDENYFPALMNEIENAHSNIDIVIYEFKPYDTNNSATQLRDSLIEAEKRGVSIRIILDQSKWYGQITELSKDNQKTAEFLAGNGISVKLDSEKTTTHDKLIIIDNSIVFVGSHNWGSSALTKNNEASVMIEDSETAEYYENYFEYLWENA